MPVRGTRIGNIAPIVFSLGLAVLPAFADAADGEIARLKDENALLRAECRELRMMLAEPGGSPARPATNRVVVVVEEKTPETVLLRAECQALRRMLATPAVLTQPAAPAVETETGAAPLPGAAQDTGSAGVWHVTLPPGFVYWLTTSSGVRHNPACLNYQKTIGRPCAADEGRPCSKCGG